MKTKISSKTVSTVISILIFAAIGICAVIFIGKGDEKKAIPFDSYSKEEYSEHEGWTDISAIIDSSYPEDEISTKEIIDAINSYYQCNGDITADLFSDEIGLKINEISFLDEYAPSDVTYSMGYIFAGNKIFDIYGNDFTHLLSQYNFVDGRDGEGNALFEKENKYYYLSNGEMIQSQKTEIIFYGPAYLADMDKGYYMFSEGGKWGLKDSQGNIIVKAMFTHSYGIKEGIASFATKDKIMYFYNMDGDAISSVYSVPTEGFGALFLQEGITLVKDGEKNIILKSSGGVLDTPGDFKVLGCSDGMILLEKNNLFGFMNNEGRWVIDPVCVKASKYSEGLSVIDDEGICVVDKSGNVIIPKGFEYISDFSNGTALLYSQTDGWYFAQKYFLN